MANILLRKTIASMLNLPIQQVDAILNAAEAFKSDEIDRDLAMKVFNKFSKKSPQEINRALQMINIEF